MNHRHIGFDGSSTRASFRVYYGDSCDAATLARVFEPDVQLSPLSPYEAMPASRSAFGPDAVVPTAAWQRA